MTGRQHSCCDALLHGDGQFEQADGVADLRTRPADAGCELFLGDAEILEQLLVGRCLFQRVQLGAVQVLEERIAQEVLVGGVTHNGRDRVEPGFACSPRPTLPMMSS